MSRSQIACALSAGSTTIARIKSTGSSSFTMTLCRCIDGGLDDLAGPKGSRFARKLVSMLREWHGEAVVLSFSPKEIPTLPAFFSPETSEMQREALYRIEAGYFLREVEAWQWSAMALEPEPQSLLEQRILMFYPAAPAQLLENELRRFFDVTIGGVHFEAISRLSSGRNETLPILELEERYTAFYLSENGKTGYFRYWPVTREEDRSYFAIRELTSAPIGNASVKVTGSAAGTSTLERISRESSCYLQPLVLPAWVSDAKGFEKKASMTSTIRAVSSAIMMMNNENG